MPRRYQKKRKTYGKKKTYSKGRSSAKPKYRPPYIYSDLQLLNKRPPMLTTKATYTGSFFVRPVQDQTGLVTMISCRAATPHDPLYFGDKTNSQTHVQILGQTPTTLFNQFSSMYNEAVVVGAKCEVHVKFLGQRTIPSDITSNPNQLEQLVTLGIVNSTIQEPSSRPNLLPTETTVPSEWQGYQNFRVSRVMADGNSESTNDAARNIVSQIKNKDVYLKAFYAPKKLLGLKDVMDHQQTRFGMGANTTKRPIELPQFVLGIAHNCDSTLTGAPIRRAYHNDCYVTMKTTYIVKCLESSTVRGENLVVSTSAQV